MGSIDKSAKVVNKLPKSVKMSGEEWRQSDVSVSIAVQSLFDDVAAIAHFLLLSRKKYPDLSKRSDLSGRKEMSKGSIFLKRNVLPHPKEVYCLV